MSGFSFWSKTYSKFVKKYYMEAIKAMLSSTDKCNTYLLS